MDLLESIAQQTYTMTDLKRRLRVLKEYYEKKNFGGNVEIQLLDKDKTWIESLPADLATELSGKKFTQNMELLTSQAAKIAALTVYLAFEMPDVEIAKLAQNIRTTLKSPTTFLEVKKDPNLLGGLALVYKGVYKDFSLRKMLENQKDKILAEMRRYIT